MTLYELAGDSHTFAKFGVEGQPSSPTSVLDVSDRQTPLIVARYRNRPVGRSLRRTNFRWPIAQAAVWPQATFVGFDLAPCHADLEALAKAEEASSLPLRIGDWRDVQSRISWEQGDL